MTDIAEAPSTNAVREHYEEQLKMLEEQAPDIHQQVEDEFKKKDGQLV